MIRSLGLKNLSFYKGASLRWKIKTIYWEIHYAIQRAWRGYDAVDVFDLWFSFVAKMPELLRKFKDNNDGLFVDTSSGQPVNLTEEQTDAIIDEMIFYFENCDEDVCYKRIHGTDPGEDYETDHEAYFEKTKQAWEERQRCWDKAMELFTKWGPRMWY